MRIPLERLRVRPERPDVVQTHEVRQGAARCVSRDPPWRRAEHCVPGGHAVQELPGVTVKSLALALTTTLLLAGCGSTSSAQSESESPPPSRSADAYFAAYGVCRKGAISTIDYCKCASDKLSVRPDAETLDYEELFNGFDEPPGWFVAMSVECSAR